MSGFLQPTKTLKATLSDGSTQRFMFDTDLPVIGVEVAESLPFFPKNMQTDGPNEFYEPKNTMVFNRNKFMNRVGRRVPPMKGRRKNNRMEQWRPYTPNEGDVIGYVCGVEMIYVGKAIPVERRKDEEIHVFDVKGDKFISSLRAAEILDTCGLEGGRMTQKTMSHLKVIMNRSKKALTIVSQPHSVYDTLMMLKLLGAASTTAPRLTVVPTEAVDDIILGYGFGDVMNWSVQNKNSTS